MTVAVRSISPTCGDERRDGLARVISHNEAVRGTRACPRGGSTGPATRSRLAVMWLAAASKRDSVK